MTTAFSKSCVSAGSILRESDVVVSVMASHFAQSYGEAKTFTFAIDLTLVYASPNERQVPAAPFDCPSIVPLYSYASVPAKPPQTLFIRDLGDRRLSLKASIPVALEFWADSVTACCYDVEDFGVGQDEFSALADLKASLVDLYFLLKADADKLGPLPTRQWNYMRTFVQEN